MRDREGGTTEIDGDFKYARVIDSSGREIAVLRPPFVARVVDESLHVRSRETDWRVLPLERVERIEVVQRRSGDVAAGLVVGGLSAIFVYGMIEAITPEDDEGVSGGARGE